jgi:hypothetical protein
MNNLNLNKMKRLAENLHAVAVSQHFGAEGVSALQALTDVITQIFRVVEPASRQTSLTVFVRVSTPTTTEAAGADYDLASPANINHELDQTCFVEATRNGRLLVFSNANFDMAALSANAIVYVYSNREEAFIIAGTRYDLINPSAAHASVFSRPTYSSLDEALDNYRARVVRSSTCFILETAWGDQKRLFWRIKPEVVMRRSLHQYLRTIFPDAEVRPEQVVDESHPVDIKVTWHDTNRRALIEIKWLGDSRDESGHITLEYRDARANEGAKQLAEYLDSDHTAGPGLNSRGYLVVIDGRRRNLQESSTTLAKSDGLYYRDREIAYSPAYHETRSDFALPVRMFAEPVLN